MTEPVDTSAEAVERLYTGNRAGSMEHRAFSTKGFRESLGYTVNPKDWVSAADYDRLQSALTAAQQRLSEQETLLAERNRQNAAAFSERDRLRDLLREARDVISDGLESDGDHEPDWSRLDRDLVARIDARLADAAMGAREVM